MLLFRILFRKWEAIEALSATMTGDNTISLRLKIGFGLGHILNDLAASIWFTYLLLYFHEVRLLFFTIELGLRHTSRFDRQYFDTKD
jgi:hypothetical protein